ncbi:hypothetical protein MMC27_004312 [Xylographa pallens]|nr:hypothetical protein [Xylographa pallens]
MPGSPSKAEERDAKLPATPARKRYVQAANAWAQEQALEAEDNFDMENVWSLAKPRDASAGGLSGDNGNNYFALSYRQNNENGGTSHSEKVPQATLVHEKNSWAQEALHVNGTGKLLKNNDHVHHATSARAQDGMTPNDKEERMPGTVIPKLKHAVGTILPSNKENKNRLITQPTLSKPFSMSRKMSLKGLRNVLTATKAVLDDSNVRKVPADAPYVPSFKLDKASRVLGLNVHPNWQSGDFLQPTASARSLEFSSSYHDQTFDVEVPNAFGLQANDTPTLTKTAKPQVPTKSSSSSRRPSKDEVDSVGILLGHGHLTPTKSGSYGTTGRLEVVGANFARISSQQGIIETVDNEGEENAHGNQSDGHPSSAVYSPSMYEAIWENHPNVGRSLPPFSSPKMPQQAQEYHQLIHGKRESDDGASASLGDASVKDAAYVPRSSVLTFASIDSIATSLDEDSSSHDSAEVLPLFADDAEMSPVAIAQENTTPETNTVPPPPSSFPNYQASAPVGFAQAMMAIHHHIETSNDRLHRLVEDKNNRTHDELIRRCESLEEKIQKNGKGASKHDLNGLKNEFDILGHDLHVTASTGTETKRMIHTVLAKVAALDELLKNNSCKCSQQTSQRLANQEGPMFRPENTMFFNGHGPPSIMSSPGYLHVPVQYNGNQFAHLGNSNSYGSFGTPQFHNQPPTNFEPRPREPTEEYYRASGYPQMMRVEIPEVEIDDDLTFLGKDQQCSIPFGIKGPNGILYEMPSFMRMTSNGPVLFDESPVSTSTERIDGIAVADDNESHNQPKPASKRPIGIDGPDGMTYDMPSFMSHDAEGQIILDQFDENGNSIDVSPNGHDKVVVEDKSITGVGKVAVAVGPAPTGIRMPNSIVYELPSFLHLNGDGQAEVVQDEESGDAKNGDAVPKTDHMPIGIRMDNGVVYELPTFMHLNNEGQAEVNLQDEVVADNGNEVGLPVGNVPVGIRGPNGVLYELPSFLRINGDGLEEVVQEGESANMLPTDGVPIGIRMNNGIIYEVPSFMNISEDGLAEIDQYNEAGTEITTANSSTANDHSAWSEGSQGIWYNDRATMDEVFDSLIN